VIGLSHQLPSTGTNLRVLNHGGRTSAAAADGEHGLHRDGRLAQMELEINRERSNDNVTKRRTVGKYLGGRWQQFTKSQSRTPVDQSTAASRPHKDPKT
jgi:DNA invertase Pin-like site-specific DNA recombinase